MDQKFSDLETEVKELRQLIADQSSLINKIILMMYVADTDLKNHTDLLDQ